MDERDATVALSADGIQPLSAEWWQARPGRGLALAFLAGLMVGWWVLGLWLFPVHWGEAEPYHLRPAVRADYLQLVANDYGSNGRLDLAAARLASLGAAELDAALGALQAEATASGQLSPKELDNLKQLHGNLLKGGYLSGTTTGGEGSEATAAAGSGPAGTAVSPAGDADAAAGGQPLDLVRLGALAILVGCLAGLAYIGGGLLLRRLRASGTERLGGGLPAARGLVHEASGPAVADDLRPRAQTWGAEGPLRPDPTMARTQAMPAQLNQATSAIAVAGAAGGAGAGRAAPVGSTGMQPSAAGGPAATGRALSSRQAPAWRPDRIDIGQTLDVRYQEGDNPGILTWLVYGPRGALVGGAGLLAQPIGGINTLDLWFADRDDVDQTRKTPTVTFISQGAYEDPVLRARLADRRLVPVAPGRRLRLETADLWLDVEIIAADPQDAGAHPSLRGLVLALTPHQRLDSLPPRVDPRAADDDDDGGWEAAALDEDIQEAFQPPRPLNFRRD